MLLLASLGVSLIIASLDRVVPLYKSLSKQRITRHPMFLKKQRLFSKTEESNVDQEQMINAVKSNLSKKHYKIREENGNLLAEKNRFARWGICESCRDYHFSNWVYAAVFSWYVC